MIFWRLLSFVLLVAAGGWAGAAETPQLPPLAGEIAGTIRLPGLAAMPPLGWRVTAHTDALGTVGLGLVATAPGLELKAEATLPVNGADGRWKIVQGTLEVAAWWRLAASRAPAGVLPEDLELTGTLVLSGEGTWRGSEVRGTLRVALAGGAARSEMQNWEATDISLSGEMSPGPGEVRLLGARLRVGQARVAGIVAQRLEVEVAGLPGGVLEVRRAGVEVLGGRIGFSPFVVNLAAPVVDTTVDFAGVALSELASLVPQALAEARGQLNGRISVRWSAALGPEAGTGSLTVSPQAPAELRLASSPGFLTGHVPYHIAFLPAWLGPLARWTTVENPAYRTLQDIELGKLPLVVESLRVQLSPDGPDGSRSASVEISARPTSGSVVERVTFAVNISGPLTQVLRLGLNDRVKVKVGAKK